MPESHGMHVFQECLLVDVKGECEIMQVTFIIPQLRIDQAEEHARVHFVVVREIHQAAPGIGACSADSLFLEKSFQAFS
jgi:hypothetical protein